MRSLALRLSPWAYALWPLPLAFAFGLCLWPLPSSLPSPFSLFPFCLSSAAVDHNELLPLKRAFAALTYRDFRILWLGAFASTIGTWMQKVAQSWLILDLTDSSFFLGLDDFLGQLPILLFTVLGGVIADRHDRRRLLMGSQYVQMTTAFALAALVWTGHVTIVHILALSFVTGLAQAFGGPAYQSLMPSLVPRAHLPNAIALNSIQFNLSRIIGSLLAGAALAAFGTAICFGLNGLSFLVVIAALLSLSVKHIDRK